MATKRKSADTDNAPPMTNDFDILNYGTSARSVEGVKMVFRDPDTDMPVTYRGPDDTEDREIHLVLQGPEAPEFARVFEQIQSRNAKRQAGDVRSDDQIERDRIADSKAIARLVVGGLIWTEGAWLDLDSKNSGDFLYKVGPLRQQAVNFVTKPGNFMGRAAN